MQENSRSSGRKAFWVDETKMGLFVHQTRSQRLSISAVRGNALESYLNTNASRFGWVLQRRLEWNCSVHYEPQTYPFTLAVVIIVKGCLLHTALNSVDFFQQFQLPLSNRNAIMCLLYPFGQKSQCLFINAVSVFNKIQSIVIHYV